MTVASRDKPADRVPPPDPITWSAVGRTLVAATAVGALLAFVGAFNTWRQPLPLRTAFMIGMALLSSGLGIVAFRLTCRIPWTRDRRFLQGAISALILTPPLGLIIWGLMYLLPGGGDPAGALPSYLLNTFVMSEALTLGAVALNRRASRAAHAGQPPPAPPPKFLERLPLKLRGAEVWAVEAEDHYLRLHTSRGQDLILLRLADAIAELEGLEGAQVHRSWWVARDAIADARRGDGRATLTLRDGSEVPVSRTYAKILRDLGWI
jgi:hypothetical protein